MKYVRIHPIVKDMAVMKDFNDGDKTWSHIIIADNNARLFFGDFYFADPKGLAFCFLRLRTPNDGYMLSWPRAREFAQTILELCDKHGEQ